MRKIFTLLLLACTLISFSTEVTFKVSMKNSGVDVSNGVYIVGEINSWAFTEMTLESDEIYSATFTLTAGDSLAFYFITTNTWDNYTEYRETVPEECANSAELTNDPAWTTDRAIIVPETDATFGYVWASCDALEDQSSVSDLRNNTFGLTAFPNPVCSNLKVQFNKLSETATVELLTINGQLINQITLQKGVTKTEFNVSSLPQGVYLIRLNSEEGTAIQKFNK